MKEPIFVECTYVPALKRTFFCRLKINHISTINVCLLIIRLMEWARLVSFFVKKFNFGDEMFHETLNTYIYNWK